MQDAAAEKRRLRGELLAGRRARSSAGVEAARAAVRDGVLARAREAGWGCVAAYEPLRTEPGSVELLAALTDLGVRVLVPITLTDHDLDWTVWGGDGSPLGVVAVSVAQAVLVPALAVARDGTRLGRGGGSYDRALGRTAPRAPVVALLFDGELVDDLPREAWDRPVTDVVTPSGWIVL